MEHSKSYKFTFALLGLLFSIGIVECQRRNVTQDIQESMICFMVNTAARLYKLNSNELDDQDMVFSPMDLYGATALAYLGADGNDGKKLARVLGIKEPKGVWRKRREYGDDFEETVHKAVGKLLRSSLKVSNAAIKSGRGIYVYNEYAIKNIFIEDADDFYDVEVKCADFKNQAKTSTGLINDFIKARTFETVPTFFPNPVSTETQSVISSSLVLVANWRNMFNPDDTYETAFHTREDGCDDTDLCVMMSQDVVPYYNDSAVAAVGIPTASPNIIMYFVLPHENVPLSDIVGRPNKKFITRILENAEPEKVVYHIPKFRIEDEVDQLQVLHWPSNITQNDVADDLTLSIFQQKVVLEINEEGIGGCPINDAREVPSMQNDIDPEAIEFVVDRPFIFFIYNCRAKTFLFYGIIYKPKGYSNAEQ